MDVDNNYSNAKSIPKMTLQIAQCVIQNQITPRVSKDKVSIDVKTVEKLTKVKTQLAKKEKEAEDALSRKKRQAILFEDFKKQSEQRKIQIEKERA